MLGMSRRSVACFLTKAIEPLGGLADLLQCLLKTVWLIAIRAQDGVDYPLEESPSCPVGVEDADRGYCHREGGVVFDLIHVLAHTAIALIDHIQALRASPAPCVAVRIAAH